MRSFFTGFIIVIALLAAIIGISPYFIGRHVETSFKREITLANNESPYAKLSIDQYKRGWFSANTTVKVTINSARPDMKPLAFDVPVTIKHGPIVILPQGLKIGLGAFLVNQQTQQFNGSIGALIAFSGKTSPFGEIKQANFNKNGLQFSLQNLILNHSPKQMGLGVKTISLQTPASDKTKPILITFDNLKVSSKGNTNDIVKEWVGKATLSLDSIHATEVGGDKNKQDVHVNKLILSYTSNLTHNNSKNNAVVNFNVQSIQIGKDKTIKPITLNYGIYGLDADTVRALNEQIQNNPQLTQQPAKLMPGVFNMLSKGLSVRVNKLMVGLPDSIASSNISLDANAVLQPNTVNKQAAKLSKAAEFTKFDPKLYIMPLVSLSKYLDVTINASLPESLVKTVLKSQYKDELSRAAANNPNIAETPESMAKKGFQYLTDNKMLLPGKQAGAVQIQVTFKANKLLVNGQEPALDLPQPGSTSNHNAKPADAAELGADNQQP